MSDGVDGLFLGSSRPRWRRCLGQFDAAGSSGDREGGKAREDNSTTKHVSSHRSLSVVSGLIVSLLGRHETSSLKPCRISGAGSRAQEEEGGGDFGKWKG